MPTSRLVRSILVVLALVIGFAFRAASLDTYGFSEDETAKLRAVDAYGHGEFSANAEHPMLMKLAVWGAFGVTARLEQAGIHVAPEVALRAPNVFAGTLSLAVIAAATGLLFSSWVGVTTAVLVAFDPNVIAINRIGKEDTFLLLFFYLAVWCYERAKRLGSSDLAAAKRWYTAAGAAFGLMLASKYLPHLLGLYALFNVMHLRNAGPNCPDKRKYYAAMMLAFLVANFAILLPSTWLYCLDYLRGHQLTHHGFQYDGRLYATDVPISLSGVPMTYYLEMMATKVPLPVLCAAAIGLVPLVRERGARGYTWLRVFVLFQVIGYSVAAAKFQRYGLPLLILVDVLAAIGIVRSIEWLRDRYRDAGLVHRFGARLATAGLYAAVVLAPLVASSSIRPFYSLQQNVIGARLAPPAQVFPEEAYDYGVREAVAEVARDAGPGAAVITDAPGVVAHYAMRDKRPDLRVMNLSQAGVTHRGEQWVLVQDEHRSFENAASVDSLRARPVWREYRVGGTVSVQLYHLMDQNVLARRGATSPEARVAPVGSS
jgi:hypothetical protein